MASSLICRPFCRGLIAGTLDIGAASLISGVVRFISQFIAGGLWKVRARRRMQTAALGVALQWAMSILIACDLCVRQHEDRDARSRWLLSASLRHPGLFRHGICRRAAFGLAPRAEILAVPLRRNLLAMMVFARSSRSSRRRRGDLYLPTRAGLSHMNVWNPPLPFEGERAG